MRFFRLAISEFSGRVALGLLAALAVAALLAPPAHADPIVRLSGLSLNDPLPDVQFYSFVPGTLGRDNWASEQLRTLRARPSRRALSLEQAQASRGNLVFTNDPLAGTDSIVDEPAQPETGVLALEGMPNAEEILFGDAGLSAAMLASGLGIEDLQDDLPELAMATGTLYAKMATQGREFMSALGKLLGLDRKFKDMRIDVDTTVAEDKKAKDERKRRSSGESSGNAGPERPEVTLKQVVRSTFKIILGAVLGAFMFMLVRRR
jgi:hypothetical protein